MKKGIVGILSVGVLSIPLTTGAFAAQDSNGNYEIVQQEDSLTSSFVADPKPSGSFSTLGVTSGKMDGGYWIRGKKDDNVYSSYKHYKKQGRASVVNGEGDVGDGGWKSAGTYSTAKKKWTSKGTNKAYYDNK
ncbi:hypothetical protein CHN50_18380 [Priestia aryabhattai]|nr:hypothetical protein CHN50_18380 [Priestia aryabhattai]